MKEYIAVRGADVSKPATLANWLEQARAYAMTLPKKTAAVQKVPTKATAKKR